MLVNTSEKCVVQREGLFVNVFTQLMPLNEWNARDARDTLCARCQHNATACSAEIR